jgi:hypothetical protein
MNFGDYYNDTPDVYRSVTIEPNDLAATPLLQRHEALWEAAIEQQQKPKLLESNWNGVNFDCTAPLPLLQSTAAPFEAPLVLGALEQQHHAKVPSRRFEFEGFDEEKIAPDANDPLVEISTDLSMFLQDCSAATAGNNILAVLRNEDCVEITKIKPNKFTIKALAFYADGLSCELKVRMYTLAIGSSCRRAGTVVAVEKRSGDAFAFGQIFQTIARATDPKLENLTCLTSQTRSRSSIPPPKQSMDNSDKVLLNPILEMASCRSETLQREAASTLQFLSERDPAMVAEACRSGNSIQQLLGADDLRIVCPTARALSSLATHCPHAVRDILMQEVDDKANPAYRPVFQQNLPAAALPVVQLWELVSAMLAADATSKIVKMHLDLTLRRVAAETAAESTRYCQPEFAVGHTKM